MEVEAIAGEEAVRGGAQPAEPVICLAIHLREGEGGGGRAGERDRGVKPQGERERGMELVEMGEGVNGDESLWLR